MTLSGIEAKIYAELATINRYGEDIHETVTIKIGTDEYNYSLIDRTPINSNNKGYQGYLYQNDKTGELFVVHGGSQSLAPADKPWTPENRNEIVKDYYENVTKSILKNEIPPQFEEGYNFLNSIRNNDEYKGLKITQLGQSLGGELAQIYGAMKEFQGIDTITFNAVGAANLANILSSNGIELSGDYSNIQNYRYGNEFVTTIAPHFGDMNSSAFKDFGLDFFHNMEVYKENDNLTFTKDENFKTILEKLGDAFTLTILPTDLGLKLILTPNGPLNISDANEILKAIGALLQGILNGEYEDAPVLKGYVSMDEMLYEIKPGDTIYGICDKYDIDMEELLKLNPWLKDRMSKDGKHILIKPDEKLRLPVNNMTTGENRPTFDVPFDEAKNAPPATYDPILVDLNGDGIKTTSVEDGVYFDHGKDGFAESSAWVNENDGILAIDKNGDGVINDGGEIFGDNYVKSNGQKATSGFDALRDLDSNNDGVIDSSDENFGLIEILKGDGSLISLEEAGIISINLSSTAAGSVDENGNTLISSGTFVKSDGSVGNLGDFNLVVDKMMSNEVDKIEVSEDIALLPDVRGFGYVRSLHQAMVRDESGVLKGLVEEFISTTGSAAKKEVLLQILYKWTGADGVADGSRGLNFDAKKLYALEKFIGKGFIGAGNSANPNVNAAALLESAFTSLMNNIYASLMSQTELKYMFDKLEIVYDFDTEKVSYDLTKVREYIDNLINEDEVAGKNLLADFTQSFINLGLKDNSNYEEYYNYYVSKGDDYIDVCDFDYYLNRDNNRKVA